MQDITAIDPKLLKAKKVSKVRITDEFIIGVGEDWRTQSGFICSSTRKGATMPEPFDDHRVGEWIIGEFRLTHFKKYRIKVTVTMLGEVEKK